MIEIPASPQIDAIATEWADTLRHFLTDKLSGNTRLSVPVPNKRVLYFSYRWEKYLYLFNDKCPSGCLRSDRHKVWSKLTEIFSKPSNLIGKAQEIETLKTECENLQKTMPHLVNAVKEICVQIYEDFTKKYAYFFMQKLNTRTCPYCNRHYTFTVEKDANGKFCARPEFDHFHDKSTFPLLAITFYNLVPSCHECNHGKGTKPVKVNPYRGGFTSQFIITEKDSSRKLDVNEILLLKTIDDFSIGFENPTPEELENITNLGLVPLYNEHKDYVMEIIEKYAAYDYATQRGLVDTFQGLFHSTAQIDDLIWGQYMHTAANPRRPLSKLTSDILQLLKKIPK